MMAPDFESTLERVPHKGLEKGHIVYERVRHGPRNGHAKWNKARVVDCNHAVVRVKFEDDGREAMMRYSDLHWEPPTPAPVTATTRAKAAPAPAPVQPRPSAPSDDEYRAWVAMGHDMLNAIDQQRAATESDMRDVADKIDSIDRASRTRIEALEAELLEAKREHQNDRAFVVVRHEQLTMKLASLNDRRHAMAALMGEP